MSILRELGVYVRDSLWLTKLDVENWLQDHTNRLRDHADCLGMLLRLPSSVRAYRHVLGSFGAFKRRYRKLHPGATRCRIVERYEWVGMLMEGLAARIRSRLAQNDATAVWRSGDLVREYGGLCAPAYLRELQSCLEEAASHFANAASNPIGVTPTSEGRGVEAKAGAAGYLDHGAHVLVMLTKRKLVAIPNELCLDAMTIFANAVLGATGRVSVDAGELVLKELEAVGCVVSGTTRGKAAALLATAISNVRRT